MLLNSSDPAFPHSCTTTVGSQRLQECQATNPICKFWCVHTHTGNDSEGWVMQDLGSCWREHEEWAQSAISQSWFPDNFLETGPLTNMTAGSGLRVGIMLVICGQVASEVPLEHLSDDIIQAVGYMGLELIGWTARLMKWMWKSSELPGNWSDVHECNCLQRGWKMRH